METEVLTRYKTGTKMVTVKGDKPAKVYMAIHAGYLCEDCDVVPMEVWTGGLSHGAGLIDFSALYVSGNMYKFHPAKAVDISEYATMISVAIANGETLDTAYIGILMLEPGETYRFSLNRPPAPPEVEYPQNPLLYYFGLSLGYDEDEVEIG